MGREDGEAEGESDDEDDEDDDDDHHGGGRGGKHGKHRPFHKVLTMIVAIPLAILAFYSWVCVRSHYKEIWREEQANKEDEEGDFAGNNRATSAAAASNKISPRRDDQPIMYDEQPMSYDAAERQQSARFAQNRQQEQVSFEPQPPQPTFGDTTPLPPLQSNLFGTP